MSRDTVGALRFGAVNVRRRHITEPVPREVYEVVVMCGKGRANADAVMRAVRSCLAKQGLARSHCAECDHLPNQVIHDTTWAGGHAFVPVVSVRAASPTPQHQEPAE